jgi:hypothetical protein
MEWIKIEDNTPPKYRKVYLYSEKTGVGVGSYNGSFYEVDDCVYNPDEYVITDWAHKYLPEPPKGGVTNS